MNTEFDEERQKFDAELTEWVGRQGLFTQLRLGWGGGGVVSLIAKLAIMSVIGSIVIGVSGFIYLRKHINSSFKNTLSSRLEKQFDVKNVVFEAYAFEGGEVKAGRCGMKGGKDSPFSELSVRDLAIPMKFGDGIYGRSWNAGRFTCSEAKIDFKGEFNSEDAWKKLADSMLNDARFFKYDSLYIGKLTLSWMGSNDEALLVLEGVNVLKQNGNIDITPTSGKLSYLWLNNQPVLSGNIRISKKGFELQALKLGSQKHAITLTGGFEGGQADPKVALTAELDNWDLEDQLPPALDQYVSGKISGIANISGSFNKGTVTKINLDLKPKDEFNLWGTFPVLAAMTYLDPSGRYSRIPFNSGTAEITLKQGFIAVRNIDVVSKQGSHLKGELEMLPPDDKMVMEWLSDESEVAKKRAQQIGLQETSETEDEQSSNGDQSLVRKPETEESENIAERIVAEEKKKLDAFAKKVLEDKMLSELVQSGDRKKIDRYLKLQERRLIKGKVSFGVATQVAERQPNLKQIFRLEGGVYWIDVPMNDEVSVSGESVAAKIRETSRAAVLPEDGEKEK